MTSAGIFSSLESRLASLARLSRDSSNSILARRSAVRRPSVCLVDPMKADAGPATELSVATSWILSTPSPVSTSTWPSRRDRPTTLPGMRPT